MSSRSISFYSALYLYQRVVATIDINQWRFVLHCDILTPLLLILAPDSLCKYSMLPFLALQQAMEKLTKEKAREWLRERVKDRKPLPDQKQIRQELGWEPSSLKSDVKRSFR